jgi:hypothetical protein
MMKKIFKEIVTSTLIGIGITMVFAITMEVFFTTELETLKTIYLNIFWLDTGAVIGCGIGLLNMLKISKCMKEMLWGLYSILICIINTVLVNIFILNYRFFDNLLWLIPIYIVFYLLVLFFFWIYEKISNNI